MENLWPLFRMNGWIDLDSLRAIHKCLDAVSYSINVLLVLYCTFHAFIMYVQFFQLYNGITLFQMAQLPEWKEWQVSVHN